MDFGALLSVAQKNEHRQEKRSFYKTEFAPPKKENKQGKALSENIKKFLAKKEEEERRKALEEKKKKENLLALRDQKTQNKINKHLKVCKAANKSVIADAVDTNDTAVTLAGPAQCDEDDYGYVSQEASAFYNKLMNKYSSQPAEKPLFSNDGKKTAKDIASTKDRVKQALRQQEIEESLPHKRKRKKIDSESDNKNSKGDDKYGDREREEEKEEAEEEEKPRVKKKPMPPPIDFNELLRLAEKKQYEPVKIEPKPKPKEEPERLMTKRQMKEYAKEKEWRERKEQRNRNPESTKVSASNDSNKLNKPNTMAYTKSSSMNAPSDKTSEKTTSKTLPGIPKKTVDKLPDRNKIVNKVERSNGVSKLAEKYNDVNKSAEKHNGFNKTTEKSHNVSRPYDRNNGVNKTPVKVSEKDAIAEERRKLEQEKKELAEMRRRIEEEKKLLMNKAKKVEEIRPSNSQKSLGGKDRNQIRPSSSSSSTLSKNASPKQISNSNAKSRPSDVKPRQFPPPDVKSRQFPPPDVKSFKTKLNSKLKVHKRRLYDDSDEEYDSDLADFIADDDEPEDRVEDVSEVIKSLFGYDKNKYRNETYDEDDAGMESNWHQQQREEHFSAKIGYMEDLEDMRLEAEEKKRKALMKKRRKP